VAIDWYVQHLYKIYDARFLEKFFRKSPLPQWVGWYNRYNQSFNYEVYDSYTGYYVRRVMPRKFPYVTEFSFIDNNDFLNTGLCIYRQQDKVYWFSLIFGTNMSNRDDTFWTEPVAYDGLSRCQYLYVHDVKFPWNNTRLTYLFINTGVVKVYVIEGTNPGKIYKVDMSEVSEWCVNLAPTPDVDVRLSKTGIEFDGKHRAFYMTGNDIIPLHTLTRIFTINTSYNEGADTLVFKANLAGTVWYTNRANPLIFPPLDDTDPETSKIYTTPHNYKGPWASGESYVVGDAVYYNSTNYLCTLDHVSSPANRPEEDSAPWSNTYYPSPLGTTGYSYSLNIFPTNTLDYEFVNWRAEADREWLLGYNQIIVRTQGGFAYILLG